MLGLKLIHARKRDNSCTVYDSFMGLSSDVIFTSFSCEIFPFIYSVADAYLQTEADRQGRMDDTTALNIHQRIYIRYFEHRHVRYMWDKNLKTFSKLK